MVTIVSRQSKQVRNFKSSRVLITRNRITINYRKEHRKEPSRARSQMKMPKSKTGSQGWVRNRITFFGYIIWLYCNLGCFSFHLLRSVNMHASTSVQCITDYSLIVKPIRSLAQLLSECKQLGDSITGL